MVFRYFLKSRLFWNTSFSNNKEKTHQPPNHSDTLLTSSHLLQPRIYGAAPVHILYISPWFLDPLLSWSPPTSLWWHNCYPSLWWLQSTRSNMHFPLKMGGREWDGRGVNHHWGELSWGSNSPTSPGISSHWVLASSVINLPGCQGQTQNSKPAFSNEGELESLQSSGSKVASNMTTVF